MRVFKNSMSQPLLSKVWQALAIGYLEGIYPRKKAQDFNLVSLPSRYQYFLARWVRKRSPDYIEAPACRLEFEERITRACLFYRSLKFGDAGGPRLAERASYAVSTLNLAARLEGIRKSADKAAKLVDGPVTTKRSVEDLAGCRRRLLAYLEPDGSTDADRTFTLDDLEDGSGDETIVNALMIDRATDEPLFYAYMRALIEGSDPAEAAHAAKFLSDRVEVAIARHNRVHGLMIKSGNSGDRALEAWLDDMLTIWETFLGREIATSVASPGDKREGKAGGPLIRYLMDFGDILGIELSPDAWRRHVRDALAIRESKNT